MKNFFFLHHHSVLLFRLPCANINSTQTIFVSLKCKFKMQTLKLQNVLLQNRSQTQLKIYRVPFLVKGGRALRFERHVAIIRITFTSFVNSISLSIAVVSVGFFYAIYTLIIIEKTTKNGSSTSSHIQRIFHSLNFPESRCSMLNFYLLFSPISCCPLFSSLKFS